MLRSLAQHAEDAGVGRNDILAQVRRCHVLRANALRMPAPPATPYTVCPRAPAARRLAAAAAHHLSADAQCGRLRGPCCWYCTQGPYPSTDHHAVGLSAAASCMVGSACGGPASHHARFAWWSGGGRGKRARKGTCTSKCTSSYPYPASLTRLKHLKHSSQSLPRIT
jgi:hypothetical protein